jgi:hypothetical protein
VGLASLFVQSPDRAALSRRLFLRLFLFLNSRINSLNLSAFLYREMGRFNLISTVTILVLLLAVANASRFLHLTDVHYESEYAVIFFPEYHLLALTFIHDTFSSSSGWQRRNLWMCRYC